MSKTSTQVAKQVKENWPTTKDSTTWLKVAYWAVIVLALSLSFVNSLQNPLFEAPDELLHYQFIRFLIDERRLPSQPMVGNELTQYHQPPLYYILGAMLTANIDDDSALPTPNEHWTSYLAYELHRDNKAQFLPSNDYAFPYTGTALVVHILRLFSVVLFGGTLLICWLLGRQLWPGDKGKQLLLLAVVALNPMLLYMVSSVNNDGMILFLGALILYLTIKALRNGFRWSSTVLIGIVWGLAILSKLSGLLLVATWSTAILWLSWRKKDWRFLVSRAGMIGGIGILISGWWFARNIRLYDEITGVERMFDIWGQWQPGEFGLPQLFDAISYGWSSYWGRFGYGQIVLPAMFYWLYLLLAGLSLAGLLLLLMKVIRSKSWNLVQGATWVLGVTAITYLVGFYYFFSRNPSGANGRYIYPAIVAFSALVVIGLSEFKWQRRFQLTYVAIFAVLALFSLGLFVPWTYAKPALISQDDALALVEKQHELVWDGGIRLIGVSVEPRETIVHGNDEIVVKACWKAYASLDRDYTFFVHLLDAELNPLGQRDTHPGLGNFPTSLWQPGDVFCDSYTISLAVLSIEEPTIASVEFGFYDGSPDNRLPAKTEEDLPLDFVIVDRIKLIPEMAIEPEEPANRLEETHFDQGVSLVGYSWSDDKLAPGQSVSLSLWWDATNPLDSDYTVFVHLLDDEDEIISQADGPPRMGRYPTDMWGMETILDEHTLTLPLDAPQGPTQVHVGLYRPSDGFRLPRLQGADPLDAVILPGPTIIK